MTAKRPLLCLLLVLALACCALLAGAGWLVATESGLRMAARLGTAAVGERLQLSGIRGRLLGPLSIGELRWTTPELQIAADGIELAWSPSALAERRIQIDALHIAALRIDSPETTDAASPPDDLTLPAAVDVQQLTLSTLHWGDSLMVSEIAGRLTSDGRRHQLKDFSAKVSDTAVAGEIALTGEAPFPLEARAELSGLLAEHPLTLALQADGPLAQINLVATAQQGIAGDGQAMLTPFAAHTIAHARLALRNIDPADWQAGAPHARLTVTAELEPRDGGLVGKFDIANHLAAPLDRERLPIEAARGNVDWHEETLRFSELVVALPGNAALKGSGHWAENALKLNLDAHRVDASRLLSTLRPTRLNGPLEITLGAERQRIHVDLKDAHFSAAAEAEHAGGTVTVTRLQLASGDAKLHASGTLGIEKSRAFAVAGEMRRFDPSLFARLPEAQLNARFEARGHLEPRPVVNGSFELTESRYAGQILTGHGRLNVAWPLISQADIVLSAGTNRLQAAGSFGRSADTLEIQIDAPDLAPFGLQGDLRGKIELAGSSDQPRLALRLDAARLGHRRLGQANGVSMQASLAGTTDSPLAVDLSVARIDTTTHPSLAKALALRLNGTNTSHRLTFAGDFAGTHRLQLVAEGGLLADRRWQGHIQDLRVSGDEVSQRMHLRTPAPLSIGPEAWSLGPAELAGDVRDWLAVVRAEANAQHLQASVSGQGPYQGRIDAQLSAGTDGPWALATSQPWQGRLQIDSPDLAWLGKLLGEGWQTGGRFTGELQLAGTPAQPLSSGHFNGEQLFLRLPEQGLHLNRGKLVAALDNNLLRVTQLTLASELSDLPRPLRLALGDAANAFAEPGRLEISGEMRIDQNMGADSAFLDFQLERLGASQNPDQWIAASGAGRLSWHAGVLGVRGKIGVDAGYWQLAPAGIPRLSDDVVIKRPGIAPQPALRPNMDLDLTVDLGRRFLFRGAGLQTRLAGEVQLSARGRDLPRASGSIRTRDGRFDAYGQQLDIERGILSFQGLVDNPALDVRAVRKGMVVEPGVQIGGTAQRPVVRLISDPELPDTDKLAWLVLGHGPESMSAGDATLLLSAAGGLLGNDSFNVVQQLKKTFGIDEFGFRQGDISGTGGRQPTSRIAGSSIDTTASTSNQIFSVGKRLSSNAMLSYEQSLGKAESVVKLTVDLTRQVSIISRAGSDNALDIFYTLTFGQPPRRARIANSTSAKNQE